MNQNQNYAGPLKVVSELEPDVANRMLQANYALRNAGIEPDAIPKGALDISTDRSSLELIPQLRHTTEVSAAPLQRPKRTV
jgi:hypothetical protein